MACQTPSIPKASMKTNFTGLQAGGFFNAKFAAVAFHPMPSPGENRDKEIPRKPYMIIQQTHCRWIQKEPKWFSLSHVVDPFFLPGIWK